MTKSPMPPSPGLRDFLYFADRDVALRFVDILLEQGHPVRYFMDADDDGFPHGVRYGGPEVTAHSTHPGSEIGRLASRFLDRE